MGLFHSIGHAISHAFHGVTHGVSKVFHGIGHAISKITPWNDNTWWGRLLDTAGFAVGGYYAGSALGLWGDESTASAVSSSLSSGALDNSGLMSTIGGGIGTSIPDWTLGGSTLSTSLMPTASEIGMSALSPTISSQLATQGLFSSVLNSAEDIGSGIWSGLSKIGSGIWDFAKEHPLLAGSIASGLLQGIGSYMQAEGQKKQTEELLDEKRREFDWLHNMGLSGNYTGSYIAPPISIGSNNLFNSVFNDNIGG